jgi:hypothetical protein
MDWLILMLYVGGGMASIVPFARYFREEDKAATRKNRYHNEDSFLYLAGIGWLCSLVWPITGLIFGTAYLLRADERKAEAARQHEMGLAEAFKIVDAQRQAEKDKQQRDLEAFDRALGIPEPKTYVNRWNKGRY